MTANGPFRADERIGTTSRAQMATDSEFVFSQIASGAAERDAHPTFPEGPFRALASAGILAMPAPVPSDRSGKRRASFAEEWRVLRAVARADGSVGRILDGHFNAVERVSVSAPEPLRSRDLAAVASGRLRLGVWGPTPYLAREHRPGSSKRRAATLLRAYALGMSIVHPSLREEPMSLHYGGDLAPLHGLF
jgi:alkylation response protein AidB-like acyl-CoA dehydrogenase